jgi:hypothetical protein
MSGASDYAASAFARWLTGQQPMPMLSGVWMGLFATLPSDANVGGVELSGNGYARAQIAGDLATSAATGTGLLVLTFASVPSWVVLGMLVYCDDSIVSNQTVAAVDTVANTVTLSAPVDAAVPLAAAVSFSAFGPPSGSNPTVISNAVDVYFPVTQNAGWGTANGWAFLDAATGGDLLTGDALAGGAQLIGGPNFQPRLLAGQITLTFV